MNIHLKGTLPFQLCKIHRAAIKITKYPEGKGRRMSGRKKEVRVVVEYKKDWLYKKNMKLADSISYRIALVDNSGTQWLERPLQIVSKLSNRMIDESCRIAWEKIHDPPLREVRRGQISCIRKRPGQPLQIVSKINPPTQSNLVYSQSRWIIGFMLFR